MTAAKSRRLIAMLVVAIAALAAGAFSLRHHTPALPAREGTARPPLMLLTSLPLVFPENFGLKGGGSATLTALERRYRVISVPTADAANLRQGRILLMAHAPAQTAEALVDLDNWVREGGRLVLLADPLLEWESERPLGDTLRPSPMFPDTGLLQHWGLRLDAPDERGPAQRRLGKHEVITVSPGALFGSCAIARDRLAARCRIGKGEAVVIADADFLDIERLDGPKDQNLGALLEELASIEPK
jgi:hypothetical protein